MFKKIPYLFNQQTVFIPKRLWNIMAENGHLDSLAYYIQIKKKFKNGTLYSNTNKYLAELTKISVSCSRKHKAILVEYGLIKIEKDTITLPNPKKLNRYANARGKVYLCGFKILSSHKNQKYLVKNYANLSSLKKQESQIKIETDSIKSQRQGKRKADKIQSLLEHKKSKAPISILYPTLSINTWAKKLNKTTGTAKRHKKKLVELNIISQNKRFEKSKMTIPELIFMRNSRLSLKNSRFLDSLENFNRFKIIGDSVFKQLSNEINLINLP